MAKPESKPEWASTGAGILVPSNAKKALGWVKEKPAFQYFNWLFYWVWKWIDWIDTEASGEDFPISATDPTPIKAYVDASKVVNANFSATEVASNAGYKRITTEVSGADTTVTTIVYDPFDRPIKVKGQKNAEAATIQAIAYDPLGGVKATS